MDARSAPVTVLPIGTILVGFLVVLSACSSSYPLRGPIRDVAPARYKTVVTSCSVDTSVDRARAAGMMTNTASAKRSFIVYVEFADSDRTMSDVGSAILKDVPAGQRASWTVTGFYSQAPAICTVEALQSSP